MLHTSAAILKSYIAQCKKFEVFNILKKKDGGNGQIILESLSLFLSFWTKYICLFLLVCMHFPYLWVSQLAVLEGHSRERLRRSLAQFLFGLPAIVHSLELLIWRCVFVACLENQCSPHTARMQILAKAHIAISSFSRFIIVTSKTSKTKGLGHVTPDFVSFLSSKTFCCGAVADAIQLAPEASHTSSGICRAAAAVQFQS